jgi:hypothetical protein
MKSAPGASDAVKDTLYSVLAGTKAGIIPHVLLMIRSGATVRESAPSFFSFHKSRTFKVLLFYFYPRNSTLKKPLLYFFASRI